MAAIDPALMEAAGFTGAQAGQAVNNASAKAAINTNQLNLGGVQERRQISSAAEDRGMLRSSMTNTQLGEQTAEQNNNQQLIDLGLSNTVAGAQMDVMQAIAQKQAEAEQMAQQRRMFDAQIALQMGQPGMQAPDYAAASNIAGTKISPNTAFDSQTRP